MENELTHTFPSHDDIAKRAYELFIEHGGVDGHDREDWLAAERELLEHRHEELGLPPVFAEPVVKEAHAG